MENRYFMGSFKSPKDALGKIANIGGDKSKLSLVSFIILGFLAGAYIAFGGMLAEIVTTGMNYPVGLKKFFFAAVFPLGLILTVLCGAELFTGSCLYMPVAFLDGKAKFKDLLKNLVGTWIFNFIGALFVAFVIAYLSGIMTSEPFSSTAITIASNKVDLNWLQALIRGIGCNWLVCLAIYIAVSSEDIISKIVGIWFPIMAFVALGFEHCIANMFFIPLAMFLGSPITLTQLFNNLIPVTVGNIIGGALFVGFFYWFVYLKNK